MSCKRYVVFSLIWLTAFTPWQVSWASIDSSELSQCKQLAEWSPTYIYENTQKGATEELYTLAQHCFSNNACSLMTDIDKPTCARTIALNSYLINIAYRTHKPAKPPFTSISAMLTETHAAKSETPTTNTPNKTEAISWS